MQLIRGRLILNHWQLILLTGVTIALWSTPVTLPLHLLVVFFHELSHALMTWATGGKVVEFVVNANVSGQVNSRGGNYFLILQSGYLGSLILGVALFTAAVRSRWDKALVAALGALLIIIVLLSRDSNFRELYSLLSILILLYWACQTGVPNVQVNDQPFRTVPPLSRSG